jgi:hypothetical protein
MIYKHCGPSVSYSPPGVSVPTVCQPSTKSLTERPDRESL